MDDEFPTTFRVEAETTVIDVTVRDQQIDLRHGSYGQRGVNNSDAGIAMAVSFDALGEWPLSDINDHGGVFLRVAHLTSYAHEVFGTPESTAEAREALRSMMVSTTSH
jgi:hypothetical protein